MPSPPGAHNLRRCRHGDCLRSFTCNLGLRSRTVWPSGLRRWLKAPFRKGVGSNPTAVTCPGHIRAYAEARIRAVVIAQSLAPRPHAAPHPRGASRRQGQLCELWRRDGAWSAARLGGASHARSTHFSSSRAPCSKRERRYAPNNHMGCHTAQPLMQPTSTNRVIAIQPSHSCNQHAQTGALRITRTADPSRQKQKLTAPEGLPRRSPTPVLTGPCAA